MSLKKTMFIIPLLMLSINVFSVNGNDVNFDNSNDRNAYLNSEKWVLKFSTLVNDSDKFKFWKEAKVSSGEGYLNNINGTVSFGNSKYGGFIWKPLDFDFQAGKEYLILVKMKPNTKDSYVWIRSSNNKIKKVDESDDDSDDTSEYIESLFINKFLIEKNTVFNKFDVKKIDYKCSQILDKLSICIGYFNYPDLIVVHAGHGGVVTTWQPWNIILAWVEIWEK